MLKKSALVLCLFSAGNTLNAFFDLNDVKTVGTSVFVGALLNSAANFGSPLICPEDCDGKDALCNVITDIAQVNVLPQIDANYCSRWGKVGSTLSKHFFDDSYNREGDFLKPLLCGGVKGLSVNLLSSLVSKMLGHDSAGNLEALLGLLGRAWLKNKNLLTNAADETREHLTFDLADAVGALVAHNYLAGMLGL